MDSGLLWSAPAKRRDRIEPQPREIPAAFAENPGSRGSTRAAATALSPGRNTFTSANPKRRQDCATWADPPLMPSTVNSGKHRG